MITQFVRVRYYVCVYSYERRDWKSVKIAIGLFIHFVLLFDCSLHVSLSFVCFFFPCYGINYYKDCCVWFFYYHYIFIYVYRLCISYNNILPSFSASKAIPIDRGIVSLVIFFILIVRSFGWKGWDFFTINSIAVLVIIAYIVWGMIFLILYS